MKFPKNTMVERKCDENGTVRDERAYGEEGLADREKECSLSL